MKTFRSKYITLFLFAVLIFNFIGCDSVEANFWDDHKESVITVIKGFVMLWILNLMREKAVGNEEEDIITSTIKKGLNLEDKSTAGDVVIIENSELTKEENQLVELVNEVRAKEGLTILEVDQNLVEIAREKAKDMIEHDYFDHESPTFGLPFNMIKERGIEYSLAGENLASAKTVEEAFISLMNSPEHKDNILKARYDKLGVGVIKNKSYGLMIVQLFIDSLDPAK